MSRTDTLRLLGNRVLAVLLLGFAVACGSSGSSDGEENGGDPLDSPETIILTLLADKTAVEIDEEVSFHVAGMRSDGRITSSRVDIQGDGNWDFETTHGGTTSIDYRTGHRYASGGTFAAKAEMLEGGSVLAVATAMLTVAGPVAVVATAEWQAHGHPLPGICGCGVFEEPNPNACTSAPSGRTFVDPLGPHFPGEQVGHTKRFCQFNDFGWVNNVKVPCGGCYFSLVLKFDGVVADNASVQLTAHGETSLSVQATVP